MTASEFHDVVLTLAVRFSFSTTSGLRSKLRNDQEHGHVNSRHLQFCAQDCVLDDRADLDPFITEALRLGVVAVDEGDHVHLQTP